MSNSSAENNNSTQNETKSMDKYMDFLQSIKPLSDKIENIRKEYQFTRLEQFNIFTAISDQYHKENLHSDILQKLLENDDYLKIFYGLLKEINEMEVKKDKTKNKIPDIEFDDSDDPFDIVREENRIDISIYNIKYGIIIENKINGAEDRDDQLARYYESISKKIKPENIIVVYIPPIDDPEKRPPLDEYAPKYQEIAKEIKNKFVFLPVIDKIDITKRDIVHNFLDKIAVEEKDETMKVFIKQYSEFLKDWGGKIMATEERKDLLKELLKKENVNMAYDIHDVLDDHVIIGKIIGENLIKKYKSNSKYKFEKNDEYDYFLKIERGSNVIYVTFFIRDKGCNLELWSDKKSKWKKDFIKILKNDAFNDGFSSKVYSSKKEDVAKKEITYLKEKHTLREKIDFVIKKIKILEEKCIQIKP